MFATFIFYLILLSVAIFFLIPIVATIIGLVQGLSNKNGNGFSDFVNSSRWTDGK